jgi:hypothetical protein
MSDKGCPFQAGEMVIYQPTERGGGLEVMTDLASLEPGAVYKIARIDKGSYVVLEGYENSVGGGLYWAEFRQAPK